VEDLAGAAVPGLPATGRGHSLIDASASGRYETQLDAEGFQADFPATGDRGIGESLDTAADPGAAAKMQPLG
jgi:hypothetical protein